MARLPAPTDRLAGEPKLRSADDVRRALEELSWIDAEANRIAAECQRDVAAVKAKHEAQMTIVVDGQDVPLPDRRAALAEAVEAYCDKARGQLLEGEQKSRAFTHGTVGWRKSPPRIEWLPNKSETTLLDWVQRACNLATKVREAAAKCFPFVKLPADLFFDLKIVLNKPRVKKARELAQVSDKQLRDMGLKYAVGDEAFYIDVNDYPVQREASA